MIIVAKKNEKALHHNFLLKFPFVVGSVYQLKKEQFLK